MRPLLDLTLFRHRDFSAAAVAVFLIGAALFGSLIILPLYFQVDRGHSTLATGLLLSPQGLGAALVMPISGRLTDRIGGGRVALVGLVVIVIGTFGLTRLSASTPYALSSAILFVRGIGLGFGMMPAMAAAYATVSRSAVPRATTTLNVLQRVGGSIGTALLAVVLEDRIKASIPASAGLSGGSLRPLPPAARSVLATPLAHAFTSTFWWAVGLAAVATVPAFVLARRGAPGGLPPRPPRPPRRRGPAPRRGPRGRLRCLTETVSGVRGAWGRASA